MSTYGGRRAVGRAGSSRLFGTLLRTILKAASARSMLLTVNALYKLLTFSRWYGRLNFSLRSYSLQLRRCSTV